MRYIPPRKERELTIDEMMELRRQGVTLREIGARLGISKQRVQSILGNTRDIKPKRKIYTPEEKAELREKRVIEKFWRNVEKTAGCWIWHGVTHNITRYGMTRFRGKNVYAHRMSYILAHGSIPDGAYILHSCDNPSCVNPVHLRAGSQANNVSDRVIRRRGNSPSGNGELARTRRKYILEKCRTTNDIRTVADRLGCTAQNVYSILLRHRGKPDD